MAGRPWILFFASALPPILEAGSVIHVDQFATSSPIDGVGWCKAYRTLDAALDEAVAGDVIRVADGVYRPRTLGLSDPRTATFRLKNGVILEGGYAGCGAPDPDARDVALHETTLSGDLSGNDGANFTQRTDNSYHVVTIDDPAVTTSTVLDGFTVRGGHADGTLAAKTDQGGGIHNFNGVNPFTGRPLVRNCLIRDNWAANHGAVNDHGGMTLVNCEFRDNHAGMWGGGLYIHENLDSTVTDCRFVNNHTDGASGGGGGAVHEGNAVFTNCLFSGNTSDTNGGGLYNHSGGTPTLRGCTFESNSAWTRAGGFYEEDGESVFEGCWFTGNAATSNLGSANGSGGAMYLVASRSTFTSTVFTDNVAATYGGAVAHGSSLGTPVFRSCVFLRNRGPSAGGGIVHHGGQIALTGCVFAENSSNEQGGGFHGGSHATAEIVNCRFLRNSAFSGGGVQMTGGQSRLTNCAFESNTGSGFGGAVAFVSPGFPTVSGTLQLVNCTLIANSSPSGSGLGLMSFNAQSPGSVALHNSILWNGAASIWINGGVPLTVTYSTVEGGWAGAGNGGADPLFVDPDGADNLMGTDDDDLRLASGSPCRDTGNNALLPADSNDVDMDGNLLEAIPWDGNGQVRVLNGVVDRGAYEFGNPPLSPCPPGTFSPTGEDPCQPCSPGTQQPLPGATSCFACSAGHYQPMPGQTQCLECECDDGLACTADSCASVTGACQHDPIPGCVIPTVSAWGVAVLALLQGVAATLILRAGRVFNLSR